MQSAWERWESFWVGGVRRGAVFRSFDDGLLVTRVAFADALGAQFACESLLRLSADGETWSGYRYRQEPGSVRAGVWREDAGHAADTLPASGEYLLVARLATGQRDQVGFRRVDEARPDEPPAPAVVRRQRTETIDLPGGRSLRAERWEVVAGGRRVGAWWAHEGALVRGTSGGALMFACRDEARALAGLDGPVARFLREGFGAD